MKLLPLLALAPLAIGTPAMADISSEFNVQNGVEQLCRSVPAAVLYPTDNKGPNDTRIVHDGIVYGGFRCYDLEPLARVGVQHSYQENGQWNYAIHTRLFKFENGKLIEYNRSASGKVRRREYSSQCGSVKTYGNGGSRGC